MLLPKLNLNQMAMIETRLVSLGYSVARSDKMKAVKKGSTVRVAPEGLARSNEDLADLLGPIVPKLLESPKGEMPLKSLAGLYYAIQKGPDGAVVRVSPRFESSSLWDELRAGDLCGLTPDEQAVYQFLLERSEGKCTILTDYPSDDCKVRRIGRRQFYESRITTREAGSCLRLVGQRGVHNGYLPRSSLFSLELVRPSGSEELRILFQGLGEWCFFLPSTSQKL